MAGKIKGIIVEIGGDTSALQKSLSKVNSVTSSLSKELKGVNSLLKLDPKNTELLSQKQTILNQNIEKTKDKLNQLKNIQDEAIKKGIDGNEEQQENYRTLQREIINTQNKLNRLKNEASNWTIAGRKIEELGEKIGNISNKIDSVGNKLTTKITMPVIALGVTSVKGAIDFETAFTGVEKTVDGTVEQMEELKKGIKNLANEIPSTTTEISAVAEAAGQLGIKTEDVLSFTKVMIDLGNSTNLSAEEAASSLAKFANVTKMSAKDYDRLGSVIVALGNNFATTESDIVSMATKLASTGELTGLTQPQIMALATAMSSVGIEAEAGGSAMSKLLKKIQLATELGGEDLEDFAKVAGMTSEEFKQAFEKDAVKALTAFIGGLNDTERNGKSAIAILDDMGLTEVRLSNTVLSLANASDVMNDSVNLSSEAWEENTALTSEANKRYETLESRLKTTLNKANNLAINFGQKLTPSVNKILNKTDKLISKLDDLDEEQTANIVKIGLVVASIGPAIKIVSKLGTTVGNVSKGISTFSQAISVMKNNTTSSNSSVNNLANAMKSLTSPTGLAVAGVTAFAIALAVVTEKAREENKALQEFNNTMSQGIETRLAATRSAEDNMQSSLAEISNIERLNKELRTLVNENGKVKEGYENRVNYILNELNNALGTEYKLNGDIVDSYKEIQNAIDETIRKKKAEIVLQADEEKFREAIKNKTEAQQTYLDTQKKIEEVEKRMSEIRENGKFGVSYQEFYEYENLKNTLGNLNTTLQNSEKEFNSYNNAISQYERNSQLMLEGGAGNYEKVYNSIYQIETNLTNNQEKEISKRLQNAQNSLNKQTELYNLEAQTNKDAKDNIYSTNLKESQKNLQLVIDDLVAMTSTTEEMSPELQEAWKNLAKNSREKYNEAISKLPTDMQEKLNSTANVITNDTRVSTEAGLLALDVADEFNKKQQAEEAGKNLVEGVNDGINDQTAQSKAKNSASIFSSAILGIFHKIWDEHSPSHATEKSAVNLLKGIPIGIKKQAPSVLRDVNRFSSDVLKAIDLDTDISKISGMQRSLNQEISNIIKPNFFTPNITINTQHLDVQELDRIVGYVNNKLGQYY